MRRNSQVYLRPIGPGHVEQLARHGIALQARRARTNATRQWSRRHQHQRGTQHGVRCSGLARQQNDQIRMTRKGEKNSVSMSSKYEEQSEVYLVMGASMDASMGASHGASGHIASSTAVYHGLCSVCTTQLCSCVDLDEILVQLIHAYTLACTPAEA